MKILLVFTVLFLILTVNDESNYLTIVLRCLILPLIALLYFISSHYKSKLYLIAMLFASISNFMFIYSAFNFILIGLITFLIFRALVLLQAFNFSERIYFVPFVLGFFLLIIPISYLFYITSDTIGILFYIGLFNIFLNAIIGGISISSYSSSNSISNTSLLVSSLFFVILSVVFIIQKFFVYIPINEPLRIVILLLAHYFYCLFLIQKEKETK